MTEIKAYNADDVKALEQNRIITTMLRAGYSPDSRLLHIIFDVSEKPDARGTGLSQR